MAKRLLTGFLFIIIGLLAAVGPYTVFPVCGAHDGKFMKCRWTAQAELGLGLSIVFLGVVLLLFAARQLRIGISIGVFINSILVLLIPNVLIGVCGSVDMNCRILTLPALSILGVLSALIAALNIWSLWRENGKEGSE